MRGENGSNDLEERRELREALIEALDENTSDRESEVTARLPPRSRRVTASSGKSRAMASDEGLSDTRIIPNETRGAAEGSPSTLSSLDSSFLSIHPLGSTSSPEGSPEPVWSIHYTQPPASAAFRPSSVTYPLLVKHGISDKTVGSSIVQYHFD